MFRAILATFLVLLVGAAAHPARAAGPFDGEWSGIADFSQLSKPVCRFKHRMVVRIENGKFTAMAKDLVNYERVFEGEIGDDGIIFSKGKWTSFGSRSGRAYPDSGASLTGVFHPNFFKGELKSSWRCRATVLLLPGPGPYSLADLQRYEKEQEQLKQAANLRNLLSRIPGGAPPSPDKQVASPKKTMDQGPPDTLAAGGPFNGDWTGYFTNINNCYSKAPVRIHVNNNRFRAVLREPDAKIDRVFEGEISSDNKIDAWGEWDIRWPEDRGHLTGAFHPGSFQGKFYVQGWRGCSDNTIFLIPGSGPYTFAEVKSSSEGKVAAAPPSPVQQVASLKKMLDEGLIGEDEFARRKQGIMDRAFGSEPGQAVAAAQKKLAEIERKLKEESQKAAQAERRRQAEQARLAAAAEQKRQAEQARLAAEKKRQRKMAQLRKQQQEATRRAEEEQRRQEFARLAAKETRIALVIGNGNYKTPSLPPLANPPNDARLMAETLRSLDFQVMERIDLDENGIQRSIRDFGKALDRAGEDAVALFYYAGHGVQVRGNNYLLPVNAVIELESDVSIEAVNANVVLETLSFARSRLNFVIIDACRNNPLSRSFRSASRGLARMDAPSGTMIGYATAPGDVAADGTGINSPYTEALTTAMRLPGLTVEQMFRQVRNMVMAKTKDRQVPWESSSLTGGDFYFKPLEKAKPPPVQATTGSSVEMLFWQSINDSDDASDFEAYLSQYPNGPFSALARNRLKRIKQR